MRYFQPDPFTRAAVAIPNMRPHPAFISAGDITNRALMCSLSQGPGTDAILERGYVEGVEWMECPDSLWLLVCPRLQGIEITTATTTMPTGYIRSKCRPRMSRFTDRINLVAITDSLGWNGGRAIAGTNSYVTKAFRMWAGATTTPFYSGSTTGEYITDSKALLHNGKGKSFFGGVNNVNFSNDHEMMRPVKYSTLGLTSSDIIYVALGTNDCQLDGATGGAAAIWARAQAFVGGLIASFPNTKIIMATLPRRSEDEITNKINARYNSIAKAGYAALGVAAIVDIEHAHANFSTNNGDSAGAAYLDGTHFSDEGITAAAIALATVLITLCSREVVAEV